MGHDPRAAPRRLAGALLLAILVAGTAAAEAPRGDPSVRARSLLAAGDTTAAVRWLEHSYHDGPDASAYTLLGRLYRESGSIRGRLRSQRVLEEARARFPDDVDVRMELGRTYFAQRFFPDAIKCFRAVLERDPGRCDARYMIGLYHYENWKRMNEYTDDLRDARQALGEVTRCDPQNADAAFKYLVARYAQEDTSLAESSRILSRFPGDARFWLYRGTLEFDARRFADCAADYERGLDLLDAPTREVYGDLERVLSFRERDRVEAIPVDRRDVATRAYWVHADPDPTTPINERRLEHVYRMFVADMLYSSAPGHLRGWETDRGQTFVKFGRPQSVGQTLEARDYRDGKTEMWMYAANGTYLQFVFVDEYLNGNPRIPYRLDFMWSYIRHSSLRSAYHSPVVPLPGRLAVAMFRDDDMSASAYLAFRVEPDSLRTAVDSSRAARFVVRWACFDSDWKRAGTYSDSLGLADVSSRGPGTRGACTEVRRIVVPFAPYHFACAFEDAGASARALARADGDATRFMTPGLSVSDVLLVRNSGLPRNAIARGDTRVWPRIDDRYGPGERLSAYVEMYQLSMQGGASHYDVRFAIYPAPAEETPTWLEWGSRAMQFVGLSGVEPTISQTFPREGRGIKDHELITVDIDSLDPGRYVLAIEVTDRLSGAVASAEAPFVKEVPSLAENPSGSAPH